MFSLEDLRGMTIRQLRLIDIKEVQEESMVQQVLNEKLGAMPSPVDVYKGDVPDIKTREDEEKWQQTLDERAAKAKERLLQTPEHVEDHTLTKEDLENNPELVGEGFKEGDVIGLPVEEGNGSNQLPLEDAPRVDQKPQVEPVGELENGTKIYCEECQSKRAGKHKLSCSQFVE